MPVPRVESLAELNALLEAADRADDARHIGVVSTLWSVEDFPTALIVSKFYEGLFLAKRPPATALREAQLWMRDADGADIDAYASRRAPLRALRARQHSSVASSESPRYSAPSFWAAFVFSGA